MTNQGSKISFSSRNVIGGFFGGDRVNLSGTLRVRASEVFTTQFSLSYNNISLPGGDFVTNLFRARISYSFTPRIYVQGLFQYNDRADLWSANLRFGWLQAANTGLFIVINEASGIDEFFGNPQARRGQRDVRDFRQCLHPAGYVRSHRGADRSDDQPGQ